jgi:hypothetical protein
MCFNKGPVFQLVAALEAEKIQVPSGEPVSELSSVLPYPPNGTGLKCNRDPGNWIDLGQGIIFFLTSLGESPCFRHLSVE